MKKQSNKNRGFTIVELIVVIVIIGILAAILIPNISKWIEKARYTKDVALVNDINRILAVEEVMEQSPNDAIELQTMLEGYGLNLKTTSKGNYILYEKASGYVVLGSIEDDHLNIKYRSNVAGVSAADDCPGVMETILAPEDFISGYWFVSTESVDGFAQAVVAIRNGDINNNSHLETIASISEGVRNSLSNLINKSVFIKEDGTSAKKSDVTNTAITNCIVSRQTVELNFESGSFVKDNEKVYPNLSVVDLPSNVKDADDASLQELANSAVDIKVTFKNNEFAEVVASASITEEEKSVYISVEARKDYICIVNIFDDETPVAMRQWKVTDEGVEISYLKNHKGSSDINKWLVFSHYTYNDTVVEGDYITNYTNPLSLKRVFNQIDSNLNGYVKYNGEYYSLDDTIDQFNDGSITSGKVVVYGKENVISEDVIIPSAVTFAVPHKADASESVLTSGHEEITEKPNRIDTPDDESAYCILEIAENVKVINNGTFSVCSTLFAAGGGTNSSYIHNDYSILKIHGNGILVSNGSTNIFGFAIGEGTIDQQNGELNTLMIMEDWSGGTYSSLCNDIGVMPFNNWKVHNIRLESRIHKDASFKIFTTVNTGYGVQRGYLTLIGSESTDSLLQFSSDNTLEQYTSIKYIGNDSNGKLNVNINAYIHDNAFSMSLAGIGISLSVFPFPLNNLVISIKDGASLLLDSCIYKLLPGSSVEVEAGASFTINTTFATYHQYRLVETASYWQKYPAGKDEAKVIVNGDLIIDDNASISGFYDLSYANAVNISSNASFTNSFKEIVDQKADSLAEIKRYTFIKMGVVEYTISSEESFSARFNKIQMFESTTGCVNINDYNETELISIADSSNYEDYNIDPVLIDITGLIDAFTGYLEQNANN